MRSSAFASFAGFFATFAVKAFDRRRRRSKSLNRKVREGFRKGRKGTLE